MLSTAAMRAALLRGLNIGMSIMGADCGDVVLAAALLHERAPRAFGQIDTDMQEEWADDTGDD